MLEFVYVKDPKHPLIAPHDHIVVQDAPAPVDCVASNVPLDGARRVAVEINFLIENSAQSPLELATSLSLLYEAHGLQFDFSPTPTQETPPEVFTYNSNICQYHQRRVECCGKCSEVCPTLAITKLDPEIAKSKGLECLDNRHLEIKQQDCIDCGKCIAVCPSGSLHYNALSLEAIQAIAKLYKGYIPLVLDKNTDLPTTPLKKEVLPLSLNANILEQTYLLTLLQESGAQVVLYAKELGVGTLESIALLNGIYEKIYRQKAVLCAFDLDELKTCLEQAQILEYTHFSPPTTPTHTKRDLFAKRLAHIVGEGDFGQVACGDFIRYGHIKIFESCTLCLACVGACNTNALSIDGNNYRLLFNPSLCTTCGYCVPTCPEKCLELERDGIALNPSYFTPRLMAEDTLFSCRMCGKAMGTTKSVLKIAKFMESRFQGDKRRIASLYVCADCKVKVMLEDIIDISAILR
ncbi:4Fe-4S binding protein [Helicobacter ailurogastricus]|uniref:Iron-sulfur cluster-binding protein n=1 Tax=Helicobacter ailurogastricus TaxID=1578720 RepID=A0A0K2XCE7_9HELI|nr:4Fe-4S binding protein [Helicobacter ailurogastricus]CRF41469.1 Iron-sulfur cluster-binding protein [Helicobacter ailurogastricus]CRF43243.1 Iron-sulfur cluster-binding protein [Helicobacter ailurogastricus]CRF43548.1 Iron-sulfur cluster-binding protein [Helicobacter ailurogastricus]